MRQYCENSPESMAQLLTALMAADETIDDAEVEALSVLDVYGRIGISPPAFANVLRDFFKDAPAVPVYRTPPAGASMPDPARDAPIIYCVADPALRALMWDMLIGLARADGRIVADEAAFLRRVALYWWAGQVPARLQRPDLAVPERSPACTANPTRAVGAGQVNL